MPKRACYAVTWSSSNQAYELYEGQGDDALDLIADSLAWSVWVSQISSFAFQGQNGSCTARKERKQRGGGYWYAYARVEGKLSKRYLGRDTDLTLTRLEQVAKGFWFDHPRVGAQDRARRDSGVGGRKIEHKSSVDGRKAEVSPVISGLPTDPLLATKLHAPRPRPHLVHRPRLLQRLQQGLEQTLILLSAPAGFGKSTLLADWLTACTIPAAWLSLEPRDNDPARFLSYLLAALQTSDPQLGASEQALLHPLHRASLESVLTLLINNLQARTTGDHEHIVLVLDNYHVITNRSIHHALSFLLEHLPPQLHLVLATREDPPLPLAQLRGRDDVLELRAADLRFTHEETATYLVEVMGLPLSAEECALLQARTEGWITGLHLAALSLLNHDDRASFIKAFSGSHHYVMDYLLEEVLSRQRKAVQDFLLQTALLERLCAPLCDAVRAQDGSQTLLDFLEHANLFLIPLDDERQWYRYHHLFAETLRQRLQQTAPTLVPELHRRASRWYEQHGLFAEAISHALAAPAPEEAARLIEQCIWTFVLGNQMRALYEWLQALPESLVLAHPALGLLYALALMYTNHWEAASACLQTLERGVGDGSDMQEGRSLLGQVVACRSLLARLSGDLEEYVVLAQRALDLLPETDTTPLMRLLRGGALLGAAHAYLVSGDVTSASEHLLARTLAFARASADYQLLIPRGLPLLARLQALQGRHTQAAVTYAEVVQLVKRPEEVQMLADSPAYSFGLGDLLREWNELEAAEHHLARGMDLIRGMVSIDADKVWLGYAALARLRQAQGKDDQALATLDIFLQRAQQCHFAPVLLAQCAALRAQLELVRGQLQAARHWAESSGLSANDDLRYLPPRQDSPIYRGYLREREYLTLARVRIAEERVSPTETGLSAVLGLLERLLGEAEANMRMHSVLEILLLRALALEVQGDRTGALAALGRALALAEPEGYLRLFLDEGPPVLALLHEAQRHGLAPGYVAKLLAAGCKTRSTDSHRQASQPSSLMEPLTARERDVLRLVLDGASNREIAHQLTLSVNTAKKHVLNICGKLNVQRRAQAIAKAQTLHLL